MKLRKTMLVVGMALTLAAVAAPGAWGMAPKWYQGGSEMEEEGSLEIAGELSSKVPATGFTSGPCEVLFEGTSINVVGMAGGRIFGWWVQNECSTNVAGCTVTPTLNIPLEGWKMTGVTVTGTTGIEIQGVTFTNDYMGSCPLAQASASGTVTGIVTSPKTISFEGHADDLKLEAPLPALAVDLEGEVEILTAGLTLN
jgi:hypothetical protein